MRRAAALILWLAPATAFANGLTTHVFITRAATERVPPGPLRDLVSDPALEDALLSGTIFPDGGYAVGDGYGERAHWEPFQLAYLEAIRARFSPPWSEEARRHIAFLLGMTSHGMADQVFDSLYMERARQHDHASDWARLSMDEATDVAFAAKVGAQPVPDRFLPADLLVEVFEGQGHAVTQDTLHSGQNLTGLAVAVVGMLGSDREAVRDYRAQFPWATSHLDDPEVPGRPSFEADVVAAYWATIWARLHGEPMAGLGLLASVPATGAFGHVRSADAVESRVSLIFAQRLLSEDAATAALRWTTADGAEVPFERRLFYGDDSHVLHVTPTEDLAPDTDYVVELLPGFESAEGALQQAGLQIELSTRAPPEAPEASGCRTSGRAPAGWALLGLAFTARARRRARSRSARSSPRR